MKRKLNIWLLVAGFIFTTIAFPGALLSQGINSDDPAVKKEPIRSVSPRLNIPIDLSGYFWVDTGYLKTDNYFSESTNPNRELQYMQGRFVLAGTFYRQWNSFFAAAKLEYIGFVNEYATSAYEPHTLDSYVKFGQKWWDFQIGRFLAWEVYYTGQGIELYTAEEAGAEQGPALYLLDYTRGHINEAGQMAIHLFPIEKMGIEISGVYGQQSNQNFTGVRPVIDYTFKFIQLVAGYEHLERRPQKNTDKAESTYKGYAARLQFILPYVTFGGDFSKADVEVITPLEVKDDRATFDKTCLGGFVDIDFWRNSIGFGYHYTMTENYAKEENNHQQGFVSYLFKLPVDGLSIKFVYGWATAHAEDVSTDSNWDNTMKSFRVRVSYDFEGFGGQLYKHRNF